MPCEQDNNPRHAGRCFRCDQPLEPVLDPRTAPNPAFQRDFLKGAERAAGLDVGWSDAVLDRLTAMEAKYGQRYRTMSLRTLLREINEESFDLGGWPVLAALMVNGEDGIDTDVALEVKQLLQQISAHGVRVTGLVERIRERLE